MRGNVLISQPIKLVPIGFEIDRVIHVEDGAVHSQELSTAGMKTAKSKLHQTGIQRRSPNVQRH